MSDDTRTERDSLGEVAVPKHALYGAQTQRAVENFRISGRVMPAGFIRAVALVKKAAACANRDLELLDAARAAAIVAACEEVAAGEYPEAFPVDVFQTGSGTSTNMNVNEVVAQLASRGSGLDVHPNDHVNMGQSSNDVIPTAIGVSACISIHRHLVPALTDLKTCIEERAREYADVVKTGRTHLMDAMPVRLDQEFGAWASQVGDCRDRIQSSLPRLATLGIGGTAVGSGVNTHPEFAERVTRQLSDETQVAFSVSTDRFKSLASQDNSVEMSGQLNACAVALMKISNDLRWMNSGPLAGLGELELPALQPGSSIMPGKVNPVIAESAAMACAQVIGNHTTITVAGQSGNFQLNVMLPVIACNLLESIDLLSSSAGALSSRAIAGLKVNRDALTRTLARNPVLVTALNAIIGYEKGAAIAKKAWAEGRPVVDVAAEMTDLSREELEGLLDPAKLTHGGIASSR